MRVAFAFPVLLIAVIALGQEGVETPTLDESLKELEWLVGVWTPEDGMLWAGDGDNLRMECVTITLSDDGKALRVVYELQFSLQMLFLIKCDAQESIRFDPDGKQYVVEYTITNRSGDRDHLFDGTKGRYTFRMTGENNWRGEGSCTLLRDSVGRTKEYSCKVAITKLDENGFTVEFSERTYTIGPKTLTVKLVRRKRSESQ